MDESQIQRIVETALRHPEFTLQINLQRNEPEPGPEQQFSILKQLLHQKPHIFLGTVVIFPASS